MRLRSPDNTQPNCKAQYAVAPEEDGCFEMAIAERLRERMGAKGWSEGELSRRSGVPQPTIHRILTGESLSPRRENVERIARALQVSQDWLFFGTDQNVTAQAKASSLWASPPNQAKKYPLISWVAAGAWQESCDNFHPGDADEWIESPENAGPHGYWLTVKGPSMQPDFPEGSRILVRPEGFDLSSGKLCIARLKDSGETTFKQYLRDGGAAYLQPLNPAFPIMPITENVEIIGVVIDGKMRPSLFR